MIKVSDANSVYCLHFKKSIQIFQAAIDANAEADPLLSPLIARDPSSYKSNPWYAPLNSCARKWLLSCVRRTTSLQYDIVFARPSLVPTR